MFLDAVKTVLIVFVATIAHVSVFSSAQVLGGAPDLVLVTLVAVALIRGSIVGAVAGFAAGLLIDTATLGRLGVTSLLLTLAGYWIGRYGETTGRAAGGSLERSSRRLDTLSPSRRLSTHAPFLSVAVVTVLYALSALVLHYMLGDSASARLVLIDRLPPSVLMNLVLAWPVYALVRRLYRSADRAERAPEIRLLG